MRCFLLFFLLLLPFHGLSQNVTIDTLQSTDKLTELLVNVDLKTLKLEEKKVDSVVFRVYVVDFMELITVRGNHECGPNEIAFFYTVHEKSGKEYMMAEFGKKIGKAYKQDDFDQLMALVEILEHQVFEASSFSGIRAYDTLKGALKK